MEPIQARMLPLGAYQEARYVVLPSYQSVSPPAPGIPNSSGTSVSATDQWIPWLRSHTRRSAKPTAAPQTTGPLFKHLSLVNLYRSNFCASARPCVARSGSALTPPLQLTYLGSFFQGSKTRRASQKSSHILPSPKAPPWTGGPAPKAHHWAGQDRRSCSQRPSLGRAGRLDQAPGPHARDRKRIQAATSEAPPSHTRPSH